MFNFARTCVFDTSATPAIIYFEIFVIATVVILPFIFSAFRKNILKKFLIISLGVLIFEVFTSPMWNNFHMGSWAYMYKDVSWILTLGWSVMILSIVELVDHFLPKLKEYKKTVLSLVLLLPIVIFFESLLVYIGIRSYSPEVLRVVGDNFIPFFNIPWHTFYYVPVFVLLIIGFYKYFNFILENRALIPVNKSRLLRNGIFAFFSVILFEIMIEPMVINQGFPKFLNFYQDVNLLMSLIWVLLIWFITTIVDKYFVQTGLVIKFVYYLFGVAIIAIPLEALFINLGFRVYGESAVSNFSGFTAPLLNVPAEVVFAIPFYFALIIGLLRYLETVSDNNL